MKKPKLNDLEYNVSETRRVRSAIQKAKSVKITINIDNDSMAKLRDLAQQTGVPYQRLLNKLLKEGLSKNSTTESRLTRVERELAEIKKRFAA